MYNVSSWSCESFYNSTRFRLLLFIPETRRREGRTNWPKRIKVEGKSDIPLLITIRLISAFFFSFFFFFYLLGFIFYILTSHFPVFGVFFFIFTFPSITYVQTSRETQTSKLGEKASLLSIQICNLIQSETGWGISYKVYDLPDHYIYMLYISMI